MQFKPGINPIRSGKSNHSAILRMIYHYGPMTRAKIARQLGLTLPTITTSISRMIAEGIVQEVEPTISTKNLGRKTHPVDVVPQAKLFAGVEMRGTRRAACLTDYRGNILYSAQDEIPCGDYEKSIRLACSLFCQMLEQHHIPFEKLSGAAFCVPGLVDSANGILKTHPGYNWVEKNICADVTALTGYTGPIALENNSCARSIGAQMFQRKLLNHVETFSYLFIASGIACPFILNTSNVFGSVVGAGEIGHMVMEADGPLCVCGNRGCLEAFSSDHAILSACAQALGQGHAPILRDICPDSAALTMKIVLEAQSSGDADVQAIIERALYILGIAIANITNFSSPQMMLIEGKLFYHTKNQQFLLETVNKNLYSPINIHPKFVFVEADDLSGARGAAAVAISRDLESYSD